MLQVLHYTKILEVNLFVFAYRLFHADFSPIYGALHDAQPFSSFIYINLVGFLNGNKVEYHAEPRRLERKSV